MAQFKIGVVIVTYKTKLLLDQCLETFYQDIANTGISHKVVVVDNASGDGTIEMLTEKYYQAHIIANQENRGPARAFNQGISLVIDEADYILVSNSDIKISPGTVKKMQDYLDANPTVDGVNGPLLNEDGSRQMMKTHIWKLLAPDFNKQFRTEFIGTTFALIRSRIFREIGGYDENYYFYNEDLDWAERAKRTGCRFIYLPDAGVIHYVSKGRSQNKSRILRETYWSNLYYFKKFYPRLSFLMYWGLRLNLGSMIRSSQRCLTRTKNQDEREQISQTLADYNEANKRVISEYQNQRLPNIPHWDNRNKLHSKS